MLATVQYFPKFVLVCYDGSIQIHLLEATAVQLLPVLVCSPGNESLCQSVLHSIVESKINFIAKSVSERTFDNLLACRGNKMTSSRAFFN